MEKRYIDELTKLAKNLDEQSQFKEADEITSLIVKIAQLNLPTPQKPVEQKGFFQNIGDATGQGLQTIGKGLGSAAKAVGNAFTSGIAKYPLQAVLAPVTGGSSLVAPYIAQKTQQNISGSKKDVIYHEKMKQRYEIQSASNNILTRTYNESMANQFTPEEARQKAQRLAELAKSANSALDTNCQAIYKAPFSQFVDFEFGVYVEKKIPLFYPPK